MKISRDAIIPHKKCIHTVWIRSYQCVSLCSSEGDQCREARAVVIGFVPRKCRIIGNSDGGFIRNTGVVLHDHDAGRVVSDRFPHPVVVAVDVDTEKIEIFRHAVFHKQLLDIFRGNEFLVKIEGRIRMAAIHQEPLPSFVFEKISRIAFDAIFDAEFHVGSVRCPNHRKDRGNNPIFAVL